VAAAFERERPEDFFGASFDSAGAVVSAAKTSLLDLATLAGALLAAGLDEALGADLVAGFVSDLDEGTVASDLSVAFPRERVGLVSGTLVASRLVFFSTI
jgi:hypothetical protein